MKCSEQNISFRKKLSLCLHIPCFITSFLTEGHFQLCDHQQAPLLPSVGQSAAAEPMQVTSGKRLGSTQEYVSSRHNWMLKPWRTAQQQLQLTLQRTLSFTRSPELGAGAICLTVKQKGVSGRSLDQTFRPEFRSAGSHTSSALLSRSFDAAAFSEELAKLPFRKRRKKTSKPLVS